MRNSGKSFSFQAVEGAITAPRGFLASGVFCDVKRLGTGKGSAKGRKLDLAMIVAERAATVAGMFTTNQVCAAPVKICAQRVRKGMARAIVINSGNANACTGNQGMRDAEEMTALAARELARTQGQTFEAKQVFVASTGRIGVNLPMANVRQGIAAAAGQLGASVQHGSAVAEAIMTSDTRTKQIAIEFELGGKTVRMGGVCKGAGMIQPGMSPTGQRPASSPLHATMLCFLTTDAAIERHTLQAALEQAVAHSFNRITVDGDMSTNDTVLILANGMAENPIVAAEVRRLASKDGIKASSRRLLPEDLETFQAALNHVCLELAKMIVRDGEGVTRFVTVRVNGARSPHEADAAARAVANSALVKTSWFGGDPNWGRIIDALGYSPAKVIEEKVDIAYCAPGGRRLVYSLKRGQPARTAFKTLCAAVAAKEFELHINLNLGRAGAIIYAADLTEEYVEFNKGDISDPGSLGG